MRVFQKDFIDLISSSLGYTDILIPKNPDWHKLFSICRKHQIIPLLYYGIINCKSNPPEDIKNKMEMITFKAVAVNQNQLWEVSQLTKKFDENAIDYMPLKGIVMKPLYPHSEMRQMCDADILIKTEQYDKIRSIMLGLGFTEIEESDHELIWDKKGKLHVELHKRLIPSYNKDYYAYYGDGWKLAVPSGEGTRFVLSDEDQFIYFFTHFAKHYRDTGIGIRHIVDLWVYLNEKPGLDRIYIEKELKKLQLESFYNNIIHTLDVWFNDKPDDEMSDFITDIIFNSGVYGNHTNSVISTALKTSKGIGSKTTYKKEILTKIFLPFPLMCQKYSFLEKAPVLLPIMWVVRWLDAIFCKRDSIQKQSNDLKLQTAENINKYQSDLNFVGLDFNFKE